MIDVCVLVTEFLSMNKTFTQHYHKLYYHNMSVWRGPLEGEGVKLSVQVSTSSVCNVTNTVKEYIYILNVF